VLRRSIETTSLIRQLSALTRSTSKAWRETSLIGWPVLRYAAKSRPLHRLFHLPGTDNRRSSNWDRLATMRPYSAIMRSAHSTRETKMAGLPNFALQLARSFSETPRAREQAPQENTGMCLATIFSRNSLSGGQPMGITASDVALRIRYVASAVRNI
jgi:hypothetical protein